MCLSVYVVKNLLVFNSKLLTPMCLSVYVVKKLLVFNSKLLCAYLSMW
jgi:hypothetical protein